MTAVIWHAEPSGRVIIYTSDVDDTPVDGAIDAPVSSNWAFDHVAGADPHTGYVLESLFDAQTILQATADNTPTPLTVGEQTIVGRITGGNITALTPAQVLTALGVHHSLACTYISGSGTAGTDGTAQDIKTITVPANTLTQVGDRLRVRMYWKGDTGAPITATTKINTVSIASHSDGGAADFFTCETYLHYIDGTHANILETGGAPATGPLSNNNVAGFAWASGQDIVISQDNIANNHIVVYAIIVDCFPKGVV
jgi:hypothetical protein